MGDFYCNRDNNRIAGKIYGSLNRKKDVVILCHGFTSSQRESKAYAKLIASLGYIAVTFDFCGGGLLSKSSGATKDMSVLTEVEDLKSVIEYFEAKSYTKSISILGKSQGGFVCALTAAQLKDRIKNLVLIYPGFVIPFDARRGSMMYYRFDPENIPDMLGSYPMELGGKYARDVIDMDPYAEASGYNGRTLIIHGTADRIVPVEYSRKAKPLYSDLTYCEIENGRHGFRREANRQARRILEKFLK